VTRRALAVVVAATAALGLSSGASAALRLIQAGGAHFPDRSFVLSLPQRRSLTAGNLEVRENGKIVSNVAVVPATGAAPGQFGVVLVIDTSNSMRGNAIDGALAAARTFADRRNPTQQLAVVTFNHDAVVRLPFTTDSQRIADAFLTQPQLALGTHIYGAVQTAIQMIHRARIVAGSIVVLSDGADTGSAVTADAVAAAAQAAHIRVYTVGLRSRAFKPRTLFSLAAAAGGEYSAASSTAQLKQIYDRLGAQIANEYLIRYRSLAGPDERVAVTVKVVGVHGSAAASYMTPQLPVHPAPPYHRSLAATFWTSAFGMLAVTTLASVLIALAVVAVLRPKRRTLRHRMAEFVSLPVRRAIRRASPILSGRVLEGADASLERTRWWTRFKEELELAGVRMPAIQIVAWTVVTTLLLAGLVYLISGSLLFSLLSLTVPFAVRGSVGRKVARQRRLFADQLPDNLQVLASALRAGHSFVGALSVVVDDCPEPSQGEFRRVIADEQLGVALDEALRVVVRRMENRDLEQVAVVAALQHETGGNTAEVLDRVTDTIRERSELRRLVQTLTAQGRMSRWIVSALPVILLVLITLINPRYMQPLFTTTIGHALLFVAIVMVVAGSLVIKRIVNIRV